MRKKIDLLASFGIYGIGLLSFLIIEIVIIKKYNVTSIANWAFYKSTIILIGSFTLLGYDQVLLRDPKLIRIHFKKFFLRALVVSLCSTLIIFFIKDYSWENAFLIFLGIVLYGLMNYNTAASRANNNLWKSQFSKNFWKFFILLLLLSNFVQDIFIYFIIAFSITVVFVFFFKGYISKNNKTLTNDISVNEAEGLSRAFLITSVTLLLAIYGEQFLINLCGDEIASAHLFKYFAVITPIALSLNGFLGFYLGPKIIRESNSKSHKSYKQLFHKVFLFSIVNTLFSSIIGVLFLKYYLDIEIQDFDFSLILILSGVSFIRGIYVTNSVYVGLYANKSELLGIARYFGIFTALYLIAVVVALFLFSGIFTAQIISVLSLINWISRFVISNIYIKRILNKKAVV
ncbi:hypothetical protein GCM10011344_10100 [Dokdonia pacifica]|uniref:Membrane protein involved in the export of O-antigen and teichoic acid n=1 Tax=Dokdonia pacifica TaxID=1627892 RepID=A0A238YLD2_9FLAO|nr:hypothetical protein [Dokdonia pacifica]GGG11369.1 hypothetical protein GCM10011344_10100 [Dokdonia pacifica]SNR72066.1 hypothetical protein SAMN06265376_102185 [Dokdonia pacifica]